MYRDNLIQTIGNTRLVELVGSFCFVACVCAMIFQQFGGTVETNLRIVEIVLAVVLLFLIVKEEEANIKFLVCGAILFCFIVFDAYFVGAKSFIALLQVGITFILGIYLGIRGLNPWFARFLFWLIIVSMAYLYSVSPNNYDIFPTQGRNFCGAYALLGFFILAVAKYRSGRYWIDFEIIVSGFSCLLLSLYTVGRGSIIACSLLVCFLVFAKCKELSNKIAKYLLLSTTLLVVLLGAVILFNPSFNLGSIVIGRFGSISAGRSDEARFDLYSSYLMTIEDSWEYLLFGINPMLIPNSVIQVTGGNLHCSYLQWHSNFGLLGISILLILIVLGLKQLFNDHMIIVAIAALAVFLRALTDTIFVGECWDIVVFYLLAALIFRTSLFQGSELRITNQKL